MCSTAEEGEEEEVEEEEEVGGLLKNCGFWGHHEKKEALEFTHEDQVCHFLHPVFAFSFSCIFFL